MPHFISPPSSTSTTPPLAISRFHCLQVRLLYEKCGHIETLFIHELPCTKLYRGWLPETSQYVQVKDCLNMTRYLAIKKASCERCHIPTLVVKQGFFAGWGRSRSMDVDAKRKLDGWTLPIHEIVKRRREWLWEVGRQEEGKRRRQDEIEKLKKERDR